MMIEIPRQFQWNRMRTNPERITQTLTQHTAMDFDKTINQVSKLTFILEAIVEYDDGSRETIRFTTDDKSSATRWIHSIHMPNRFDGSVPFLAKSDNTDPNQF